MTKKIVIQLVGYSCSGKSTIGKLLRAQFPGMYHVAYDKQKWLLSEYNRDTDTKIVKEITFGLFETVCALGIPINLEYFRTEEEYEKAKVLAEKHGYTFHVFELTAPYEVLLERFHKRVAEATQKGSRISMTTDEVFNENYKKGYFKPEGTHHFDTTKLTESEILEQILKLI